MIGEERVLYEGMLMVAIVSFASLALGLWAIKDSSATTPRWSRAVGVLSDANTSGCLVMIGAFAASRWGDQVVRFLR